MTSTAPHSCSYNSKAILKTDSTLLAAIAISLTSTWSTAGVSDVANYLAYKAFLDFSAVPRNPADTLSPATGVWVDFP
ncbi:MAG: hypothetical protein K9K38_16740 [Rhodoferax sp.]|nr:hypothetical protein [Rhodoferax sp.]